MADNKFKFGAMKAKIVRLKKELPIILANNAQNYFVQSFTNQGWDGSAWKEVNRRIEGTKEYKYPKSKDLGRRTRPILIGKGSTKLRRAVSNSIRNKTWPIVRLLVDLPYAKRHNEGLDGMPKRTFMKNSPQLERQQKEKIKLFMDDLKKI